jgi:fructosamine-3-kinase
LWDEITAQIESATGGKFRIESRRAVGGGCINSGYRIDGCGQTYFIKLNRAGMEAMFAAEAEGLREITNADAVRAPEPVCWGTAGQQSFLVMEHIEFGGRVNASARMLGEQLARMHRTTNPAFGWHMDNTIGSTPQINTQTSDWISFWRDRRLGFQLKLAAGKGFRGGLQDKGERLMANLDRFFTTYTPQPSLLHGDLWGGNHAVDRDGRPVIFDPAVYYGDREADVAMTELFGGFSSAFYDAYNAIWLLDGGNGIRKQLYNLYHILNHANLFGGGYAAQAESMMDRLLAEM